MEYCYFHSHQATMKNIRLLCVIEVVRRRKQCFMVHLLCVCVACYCISKYLKEVDGFIKTVIDATVDGLLWFSQVLFANRWAVGFGGV